MNSVNEDRVGAASGINNAVARVAGVLAIAVLGIVMVKAFGFRLNHSLTQFSLPTSVLQEIRSQETRLAGLQASTGVDPSARATIAQSIGKAFVFGYRIIMLICAGLALASASVAWLMIPKSADGPLPRSRSV
jgi:uncharacterized membrane protein